jgi:transposase
MIQAKATIVELDMGELEEILRRIEAKELRADDYDKIRALIESYVGLFLAVGDKNTTIRRLRQMLFGAKTEKTSTVLGRHSKDRRGSEKESAASSASGDPASPGEGGDAKAASETNAGAEAPSDSPTPSRGHGRNGAEDYTGAEKINVPHPSLVPGDPCPACEKGTVYQTNRPGVLIRLVGQAPIGARVYHLQKLRCNLCGVVFTAEPPAGMGDEKCDATVGSMIALLKYGTGMPFHRAEKLQESLGIPLPASTQWDIVDALAGHAEPVFEQLVWQAAQGDVLHNDDTGIKILEVMAERARQSALAEETAETAGEDSAEGPAKRERTGTFTSGIVATGEGRKIALFLSGRQHAGENLKDVLTRRAAELPPPIQMCDALSRNVPGELRTLLANCLVHGRRQFVDVANRFPEECRHVLESLAVVYHNDALARQQNLSPDERLLLHQRESGPIMEDLHVWLVGQIDDRRVEPNSALGGAMAYLLRHWKKLTLFLRVPGAPLDNNICERALKRAILHRKNALFYKTCHGAHVGDLFMSLICTCELCGANPFDYLTELERHADEVRANPQHWMPWNYRQAIVGTPTIVP